MLEKTPESLLNNKEIKPANLKGNLPWILVGMTDAEAEAPVFWSPGAISWLIGKVPDARKDWGQKEKRASEDELAGWHHWCNGHEIGHVDKFQEMVRDTEVWRVAVRGVTKSWTWLGEWTTTMKVSREGQGKWWNICFRAERVEKLCFLGSKHF